MKKKDLLHNLRAMFLYLTPAFKPTYTVAGLPASGSTFIYQVLYELGKHPRKIHGFTDDLSYKFITYRDPRDIICSQANRQFRYLKESAGAEAALIQAHFHLFVDQKYQDRLRSYRKDKRAYFVRYEDFFCGREEGLVNIILEKAKVRLSRDEIHKVSAKFSLEANMERSKKHKDFSAFDKKLQVHGNHISNMGRTGVWKEMFTKKVKDLVKRDLNGFLIELNYEDNDNW